MFMIKCLDYDGNKIRRGYSPSAYPRKSVHSQAERLHKGLYKVLSSPSSLKY